MHFSYRVFGLHLNSNLLIPGLLALSNSWEADVRIWLDVTPSWLSEHSQVSSRVWYVSPYVDKDNHPVMTIWKLMDGAYFQIIYCDRTQFIVNQTGTEIWSIWPDNLTLEDTATYLLGPVLGFVLRLRGVVCLHASAVAIGNQAMAIVGPGGAGKSTTAAALAKSGVAVLADDVVALLDRDGKFWVQPAYPRLRLWPTSVQALYGKPDILPCLTPNWDKRYLDLTQKDYRFQQEPLLLTAIYILGDRSPSLEAPWVETIPDNTALISLVKNTYMNNLLNKDMRAKEFDLLSDIVNKVTVKKVIPNQETAYLSKLCQLILEDFQKVYQVI